jgi:hypothetical protein
MTASCIPNFRVCVRASHQVQFLIQSFFFDWMGQNSSHPQSNSISLSFGIRSRQSVYAPKLETLPKIQTACPVMAYDSRPHYTAYVVGRSARMFFSGRTVRGERGVARLFPGGPPAELGVACEQWMTIFGSRAAAACE